MEDRPFLNWEMMRRQYCYTVTDPDTVAFVAEHLGARAVDPMAGSGYWAYVLRQAGVDVVACDAVPPPSPDNIWHYDAQQQWVPVKQGNAIDTLAAAGSRSWLLSWPPGGVNMAPVVKSFSGDRVVYLGEGPDTCGNALEVLDSSGWRVVASHDPVKWFGLKDFAVVFERGRD